MNLTDLTTDAVNARLDDFLEAAEATLRHRIGTYRLELLAAIAQAEALQQEAGGDAGTTGAALLHLLTSPQHRVMFGTMPAGAPRHFNTVESFPRSVWLAIDGQNLVQLGEIPAGGTVLGQRFILIMVPEAKP